MKNLKVSRKLLVSFGVILLLMVLTIGIGIIGMRNIRVQTELFAEETLPNVNGVWNIRENLTSVQRYILLALETDNDTEIRSYLDQANAESEETNKIFEEFLKTTQATKEQLDSLKSTSATVGSAREEIGKLLLKNTEEDNKKAMKVFNDTYKPAADKADEEMEAIAQSQFALSQAQADSAEKSFSAALTALIAATAAALLIAIFLIIRLTRYIMTPLREIESAVKELANGNLDMEVVYESKDEFGNACEDMRLTMKGLRRIINEISDNMASMEHGDFTIEPSMTFPGAFSKIEVSMGNFISHINEVLLEITEAAEQVNGGVEQVSSGAQALAQGATEQASSVQELAATINEISSQIGENAKNARAARQKVAGVGEETHQSNQKMTNMVAAMGEISQSSHEIGKIIKIIENIAFQTNILALNAAVEAARAGAAGKGFAVVADEVRNLAIKSSEASKNTSLLIDSSLKAVENGSRIADETAAALSSTVEGMNEVAGLIDRISNASTQQAEAIGQITVGIDQISTVVQTNSATSEESAAASEELSAQSQTLKNLASEFELRRGEETFKREPSFAAPAAEETVSVGSFENCVSKY